MGSPCAGITSHVKQDVLGSWINLADEQAETTFTPDFEDVVI
jgi:hypothetical protein